MVLPSFQLATRLNSLTKNETEFINEIWPINLFRNIGISNWHNNISTSRKCCFWLYFSSLHDFWPPRTWNSLQHTSWSEMERCEKRAFQLLKMRQKNISWNIKTNCLTYFSLRVRSSIMKNYTCHYVVST